MIKKSFLLILSLILVWGCGIKNNKNIDPKMTSYDFEKAWEKVDALEKQGLFKTLFNKVNEIHKEALINDEAEQLIKSLVYQGKYYNEVEEDGMIKTIDAFEKSIDQLALPEKAILQSLLAELYDIYLMGNLYKLSNRLAVENKNETDIRNWSPRQFVDRSTNLFLASVSHEGLDKVLVEDYKLLIKEDQKSVDLRGSLLDILGHRAIDFFREGKAFLIQSPDRYILNDETLFSSPKEFSKMDLSSTAKSMEKTVLLLYQDLLKNHYKKSNENEILDLEIHRLNFVYRKFISADKDVLFEEALERLIKDEKDLDGVSEAYYYLANLYFNQYKKNYRDQAVYHDRLSKAHLLCESAIKKYPDTYGADLCKGLKSKIENKILDIKTEQVNLPGEKLICKIDYKNIAQIHFKVLRLDKNSYEKLSNIRQNEISDFIAGLDELNKWSIDLPSSDDFKLHSTEIAIDPLKTGVYALLVSDNSTFDFQKGKLQLSSFFVSNLSHWHTNAGNEHFIYVVNRKTGYPVENVTINLYEWDYKRRERIKRFVRSDKTNSEGYISFNSDDKKRFNYVIELETENEALFFENSLYAGSYNTQDRVNQKVLFFLDRSIYRPGQTVYFKGILIEENSGGVPKIIADQEDIKVDFYDVNHQSVESLIVDNNEYASFSGSFVIPSSGLTGKMSIGTDRSRDKIYFNVEEYKRPKFHAGFLPYEESYKLGDKIHLKGEAKSFSGVNIANSQVVYRVKRKTMFPYWRFYYRPNPFNTATVEIANGMTMSDDNGNFEIPVELLADDVVPEKFNPYFLYFIEADVIDATGETHTAKKTLKASWLSRDVSISLPKTLHQDSLAKVEIIAKNWSGQKVELEARLKIQKLVEPTRVFRKRFWNKPDVWIYSENEFAEKLPHYSYKNEEEAGNWEIASKLSDEKINTTKKEIYVYELPKGSYKLTLNFIEPSGKEISLEKFISIVDDVSLPPLSQFTLETSGKEPGETAQISMKSSVRGLPVVLEVFEKKDRNIHEWKKIHNKESIGIKIEEKHRGNFFVRASYVYNNRFYTIKKTVVVPWTNKKLDIEYTTFRSKLKPGEEEKWILKVSGPDKDKVLSEMLASMYDASLDEIKAHNWQANIYRTNYLNSSLNYFGFGQARTRNFADRNWNSWYNPQKRKTYKRINWFGMEHFPGFSYYKEELGVVQGAPPETAERMMSKRVANGEISEEVPLTEGMGDNAVDSDEMNNSEELIQEESAENEVKDQPGNIRTNLNETVFFYPHLKTDEEGNVLIEFTMNEALTTWKFMSIAHTKDLKIGLSENEVITQKELMVQPNAPRFIRKGDKVYFSSSIANLSGGEINGTAKIKILDASGQSDLTGQLIGEAVKTFQLKEEAKTAIRWEMVVSHDFNEDLLIYQVRAEAGQFSDGEEGYLPLLSNRKLITETMPFWIGGNEEKEFEFSALDKIMDQGLVSHQLTIESTSNPIWYAIQALPYLRNFENANSVNLANALYANTLSTKIIEENPMIKRVFEEWKQLEVSGGNSLKSNLEKNEELKSILLKESPWLLEGLDESTQKRNIALLFELNQVKQDKSRIIQLLKNLQRNDGGFSWFKGGYSSEFMTLYVLEIFGKLSELQVDLLKEAQIKTMLSRALKFSDLSMTERYDKLLERSINNTPDPKVDHLSRLDIYYLYVRSLYKDIDYMGNAREANVFYLNQAEKYWLKKGFYLQGLLTLALHNRGNSDVAIDILNSLEERSIYKEELGRYWKHYHGYHWSEFPIETQAMLIDAFDKIKGDAKIIQEMQVWLLKNKQTNRWKTGKGTVAAINALLKNSGTQLQEYKKLELTLGGKNIEAKNNEFYEPGSGYFKSTKPGKELDLSMKNLEVRNKNESIAWGALYWQYFQDLDKIKSFEDTPLKVQRNIFKVKDGKKGDELFVISKGKVSPGDKLLVRMRIEVDRPMDYIHLSDQKGGAVEGLDQISQYHWTGGLFYYLSPKDSSTDIFIEHLERGVYTIEYFIRVVHSGDFSNGVATIQSMYAPEFSSHSEGIRLTVGEMR